VRICQDPTISSLAPSPTLQFEMGGCRSSTTANPDALKQGNCSNATGQLAAHSASTLKEKEKKEEIRQKHPIGSQTDGQKPDLLIRTGTSLLEMCLLFISWGWPITLLVGFIWSHTRSSYRCGQGFFGCERCGCGCSWPLGLALLLVAGTVGFQ